MDYKPNSTKPCDYDEFILRSFYTTNPSLSSLQEVILMFFTSTFLLSLGVKNIRRRK